MIFSLSLSLSLSLSTLKKVEKIKRTGDSCFTYTDGDDLKEEEEEEEEALNLSNHTFSSFMNMEKYV